MDKLYYTHIILQLFIYIKMYAKLKQNKTLFDLKIKAIWKPWSPILQTIKVTIQMFCVNYWWVANVIVGSKKSHLAQIYKTTNLKFILLSTVRTEMNIR